MAAFVHKPHRLVSCLSFAIASAPIVVGAQSAWGEPIAPPPTAEADPEPSRPNPDWADAPPTEYEERSSRNPDWVDEVEAPPIGASRRKASEFYDLRYANRSLTMPRGMMRGTFDTVVGRDTVVGLQSGDTVSTMSFGVAITLADDFEIGFSRYRMGSFPGLALLPDAGFGAQGLVAFRMSPDAEFGDIPFYARFEALDREVVKLAFDAVFRIPSQTTFGFLGGVPLRFVIDERFAIDTGASFTVDDNRQGPAVWGMQIPVQFVANATDRLFVEVASGMSFFDLSHTIRTATSGLIRGPFYFIPVGLRVGYTAEARATMMDVFASFRFPTLYGFTSRDSSLTTETWQVTIGFNVYSPILFKGSAL